MTADILAHIVGYKRREVAERQALRPYQDLAAAAEKAEPPRGFRAALEQARHAGRAGLIAEIKKASPSKGLIRADFAPSALARAYQEGGATCLSVLTDGPSFSGDPQHLIDARRACALPVIRKDFLVDPWQVVESRAMGADAILIILAVCDDRLARGLMAEASRWGMDVLVEVHDAAEMTRANALGATLIGVNNRSLRTFETSLDVTEMLAPHAGPAALLVAESGIVAASDIARLRQVGASAFLVGESLMRQTDVAAAVRNLLTGT